MKTSTRAVQEDHYKFVLVIQKIGRLLDKLHLWLTQIFKD